MGESNSNYPMGVDGSHDYFNQPDPPECPHCCCELMEEWHYCPMCGKPLDWDEIYGAVYYE